VGIGVDEEESHSRPDDIMRGNRIERKKARIARFSDYVVSVVHVTIRCKVH
jgi:hypothetical protein